MKHVPWLSACVVACGLTCGGCGQRANIDSVIANGNQEDLVRFFEPLRKDADDREHVLLNALRKGNEKSKIGALRALTILPSGSPDVVDAISDQLTDQSVQVRREAAAALIDSTITLSAIERLREALGNDDSDVRICASIVLMKTGDKGYLFGELNSDDPHRRIAAIYGLSGVGLNKKLESDDRARYLQSLAKLARNDSNKDVRRDAKAALEFYDAATTPQ